MANPNTDKPQGEKTTTNPNPNTVKTPTPHGGERTTTTHKPQQSPEAEKSMGTKTF